MTTLSLLLQSVARQTDRLKAFFICVESSPTITKPSEKTMNQLDNFITSDFQARVVTVSPQVANEMLEKLNKKNRRFRIKYSRYLAEEINNGRWKLNGDAVRISKSGVLLDGQHRLGAILVANKEVEILLISGLDDNVFDTIDQGLVRTGGDILQLAGYSNCNHLASAARLAAIYTEHDWTPSLIKSIKISKPQILEYVAKHPELVDSVSFYKEHAKQLNLMGPPGITTAFHFVTGTIHKVKRDAFFEKLASGADLSENDPILTLRNRLISLKSSNQRSTTNHTLLIAFWVKAWNAFYLGKKLTPTGLRWTQTGRSEEGFPKLIEE